MSEWLASLRTTNGMRLLPPVSLRTRCARYKPDTAVDGTAHEADTAQLPQSMSPVAWHRSCRPAGSAGGWPSAHVRDDLAGAIALVVPHPQDVDVIRRRRRADLERLGLPGVHAHRRGEALERRVPGAAHLPVAGWVTGQRFSQAMGLIVGPQLEPAAAAGGAVDTATTLASATTSAATASIAILRLEAGTPIT